jgi:hypothetical protein
VPAFDVSAFEVHAFEVRVDILKEVLHSNTKKDIMERLNLNIPEDARKTLQRLARSSKRREAELARELLLRAIRQAEKEEFIKRLEATMTPAARQRHLELAEALERLRG